MNKSIKKWLVLLLVAVVAFTALTLVACEGLFGGGGTKHTERLEIQAYGQIPYSVTKDELREYITVLYFDTKGSSRPLSTYEYEITDMTRDSTYDDFLRVTVSYNGLTVSQTLGLAEDPTIKVFFISQPDSLSMPSETYKTFKEGAEIKESDLPTLTNNVWTFLYWCYDQDLNHRFDGSVKPHDGMQLFAKWQYNLEAGATEGLKYEVLPDCVRVIGIGTATDKDIVIPALYVNKPITEIGENAFKNSDITSVTMPNTVEKIYDNAFSNCTELSDITLSSKLAFIGERAFYGCTSLTEITIPSNVSWIMSEAFAKCSQLTKFEYNPTSEEITLRDDALYKCTNLVTLAAPLILFYEPLANVTDLTATRGGVYGNYMQNFPSLQTLTIGENVTEISDLGDFAVTKINFNAIDCKNYAGAGVLSHFTNMPEIVIGDKVETIPNYMFQGGQNINSIELPESVSYIGTCAFENSTIENITILGSTVTLGSKVFDNCRCDNVVAPMSIVDGLSSYIQRLTITNGETLIGKNVYSYNLTELTLPDTLTSLGNVSFVECTKLDYNEVDGAKYLGSKTNSMLALIYAPDATSFEVAADVKAIYPYAFANCSILNNVTVNSANANFTVNNRILYGGSHTNLIYVPRDYSGTVSIPSWVTTIPDRAFQGLAITSVTLPASVTSIGNDVFFGCTNLSSVTINANLTSIPDHTFYNCAKLENIVIPSTVKTIGSSAFQGCSSLKSINIPDGVTYIRDNAFRGCTSLESIELPASLRAIGNYSFYGCKSLATITFAGTKEQYLAFNGYSVWVDVIADRITCSDDVIMFN